jgi:hypothetical protein
MWQVKNPKFLKNFNIFWNFSIFLSFESISSSFQNFSHLAIQENDKFCYGLRIWNSKENDKCSFLWWMKFSQEKKIVKSGHFLPRFPLKLSTVISSLKEFTRCVEQAIICSIWKTVNFWIFWPFFQYLRPRRG